MDECYMGCGWDKENASLQNIFVMPYKKQVMVLLLHYYLQVRDQKNNKVY
jgi:hypothetical protein